MDTWMNNIHTHVFDLAEYEKSAIKYKTDVTEKPPFNYSHIIGMAMLDYGRATLQQICAWIESKFAFFRVRKKWNNSIRHNLSLHHCFRNRKREEKGKGGYWELGVDPKM
ncbi:forkhead box protein D4-like isoform X1 [Drosophila sulfurigaster albostrigata]|uniref:forkhead box protein D4-like isoform X1 n=1 Tax=Drosophila sulfurigaster albostrigata TaxID=89887 RepID=UPI002D21ADEE|nr:forkhead box protein D4-like isoform X1 [Drosophila sulfurigaster albostrigata]XP_062137684.1 forkhead box protein D4-like isoform X1 [Drosophila sulfurigaster albostrigata]